MFERVFIGVLLSVAVLAHAAEVKISPSTTDDSSSGSSATEMKFTGENLKLADALKKLYPGELAVAEENLEGLPAGRFNIEVSGCKVRRSMEGFEALSAEIQKQFGVKVSVEPRQVDGLELSLPDASKLKKSTEDDITYFTGGKGWVFKGANLSELAKWLSKELKKPVQAAKDAPSDRYDFDLEADLFEPATLPAAMAKLGFKVADAKVEVNSLVSKK